MYHSSISVLSATMFLCVSLLFFRSETAAQITKSIFPRVLKSVNDESCVVEDELEMARSRVKDQIQGILQEDIVPKMCQSGRYENFPANSCGDIHQDCPSGYYWIKVPNSDPQRVYCTSNDNRCCHHNNRKWMRIGYLNMSEPDALCPNGWREVRTPVRCCRRNYGLFVNSVNYSSNGIPYTRVCGRILAYQYGAPEAFGHYTSSFTLDSHYVDGISITYGNPRQHIWTFVAGVLSGGAACPCSDPSLVAFIDVPPFINSDYFCEVGSNATTGIGDLRFIETNPLWDGQGCNGVDTCCEFNNPPWFCQQLPEPTTEDIEIRSLTTAFRQLLEFEDTPVRLIEIYVQ